MSAIVHLPEVQPVVVNYREQQVAQWVIASAGPDFENYPIRLTKAKIEAIPFQDLVFSVLTNTRRSPSQLGGIIHNPCDLVRKLDSQFRQSGLDYQQCLANARSLDLKRIRDLEGMTGWFKFFRRFFREHFTDHRARVLHDGSVHRYGVTIIIGDREAARLRAAKNMISEQVLNIDAEIERLSTVNDLLLPQDEEYDRNERTIDTYTQERGQLEQVFCGLFPGKTLEEALEEGRRLLADALRNDAPRDDRLEIGTADGIN